LRNAHAIEAVHWQRRSLVEKLREQFWRVWEKMF
jgi:hypothetical protein